VTLPLLRSIAPELGGADPQRSGGGLELGDFEAAGPLLVLVGAWAPLFELFSGARRLVGGRLEVLGMSAEAAAARGDVGLLPRDTALPPTWSAHDVVVASAELLGDSTRAASSRARQTFERLGLSALAGKRLTRLRPAERRALAIAVAAVGEPPVLALEQPFSELEPSEQAFVGEVLGRALPGRAALVSVAELPGNPSEDALAAQSAELLFVSGQRLVARGSYRELGSRTRSYRVVVKRSADALLSLLTEAGYEARPMWVAEVTTLSVTDRESLGTLPLFRAALAADAPILELVAIGLGGAGLAGIELGGAPGSLATAGE
jgi:ABC-type multidrug transport system ATPase subunit